MGSKSKFKGRCGLKLCLLEEIGWCEVCKGINDCHGKS